jgi:hypothetical protein
MVAPLLAEQPAEIELSATGFSCHGQRPLSHLPKRRDRPEIFPGLSPAPD